MWTGFSVCFGFSTSGIDFRQGDGLSALDPGEVDVVCAAGIAAGRPSQQDNRGTSTARKLQSCDTQASCLPGSQRCSLRSALCCSPACQPLPRRQALLLCMSNLVMSLGEAMMELRCRMADFGWALQDEVLSIEKGWETRGDKSWASQFASRAAVRSCPGGICLTLVAEVATSSFSREAALSG